jgi:hypothetical protein
MTIISGSLKQPWSNPTPSPKPIPDSPTQRNLSFIAIQEQQRQQQTVPNRGKMSLREIQEQEAANQQESEFLEWWAAEEEKVRLANVIRSDEGVQRGKFKAGTNNRRKRGRVKDPRDPNVLQGGISIPGS